MKFLLYEHILTSNIGIKYNATWLFQSECCYYRSNYKCLFIMIDSHIYLSLVLIAPERSTPAMLTPA